jgi:hypothetical protein
MIIFLFSKVIMLPELSMIIVAFIDLNPHSSSYKIALN